MASPIWTSRWFSSRGQHASVAGSTGSQHDAPQESSAHEDDKTSSYSAVQGNQDETTALHETVELLVAGVELKMNIGRARASRRPVLESGDEFESHVRAPCRNFEHERPIAGCFPTDEDVSLSSLLPGSPSS